MGAIASQITSLTIVYSTVYSGADQRKHQSSASLAFMWGIHRGPVNSPHKWPVTRKMFPFDDVIMRFLVLGYYTGYDLHGKYMVEYTLTVGLWSFQRSSPMTHGWISRADVWKQVPRYAPLPMLLCGWKKTLFSLRKNPKCVYMRSEVSLVLKQGRFTISCLWKRGCGTQEAGQQAFMASQLLGETPLVNIIFYW